MNVRFLEAFVWVCKLGSFKAAAEKLHTTQAGLSSRIATLEEQFGVRLFERDRRSIVPTYQGSELLPLAERMVELQSRIQAAIGRTESFAGMLRIGAIETVVHTWLPDLLSRFAAQYPNVTLELTSDVTPRLRDELLRGSLDCALLSEEITPGFIDNRRIASYPMRWVASPELAARLPQGPLTFAQIAGFPIISLHRESSVYRNIAQGAADCANLRVSFFSSLAAMIDLARSGFGIAPLPLPVFASLRMEPASPIAEAMVAMAALACAAFAQRSATSFSCPAATEFPV